MITRYFDLMLFKNGTAPCINVSQSDESETWVFTLYGQGGVKYTPSSGSIVGMKADGHLIAEAGTVDGQGRVVITETREMTASAGKAVCELQIDNLTHGTANFYLLVEPSPADGADPSESDLSLFQEAIDAVSTIETLLDGQDPNQVIEDAVDAWLDDHPEATTTVQDGAITAPKLNEDVLDLLIAENANGNPVVISDGAKNVPVKSLVAEIVPIQSGSGDPAPDNVRPITGHTQVDVLRTGRNIIPSDTYQTNSNTLSLGTSTGTGNTQLKAGTNYTFSCSINKSASLYYIGVGDGSGTRIDGLVSGTNNITFTVPKDNTYRLYIYVSGGFTSSNINWFMLELGSTASPFEPYQGITKTTSLGTTVYGGTLDLTTGVLTTLYEKKKITSFSGGYGATTNGYAVYISDSAQTHNPTKIDPEFMVSNVFHYDSQTRPNVPVLSYGCNEGNDWNYTFVLPSTVTSLNEANAWLTSLGFDVEYVYKLATPTTTQLTAEELTTLLGNNVISASSGSVAVVYRADTKMYIDNAIASVI